MAYACSHWVQDGGGIRGLSELIIIEEFMERIKGLKELNEVPKPADYFDLIGGTSTGGLIAILLGRLRLSVADAINAYETLAKKVFSEKKAKGKDGTFKASNLEEAIQAVVEDTLGRGCANARMYDSEMKERNKCRAFVCATGASDITHPSGPTLFRSYEVAKNKEYNCCIWEAGRATSAAPTFFKRIKIGPHGSGVEYIDAGLGYNNPVNQVIAEAARIFGENAQVACVVSIGTGQSGSVGYAKPDAFQKWLPTKLIDILQEIATDSGKTAEEMEQKYKHLTGIYYRLDVDRGLQSVSLDEWKRLGDVRRYTKNYTKLELIDKRIDNVVKALIGSSSQTCEVGRLVGSIESTPLTPLLVNIPNNLVTYFVTRRALLDDIRTDLLQNHHERTVVLRGMGGTGKTQLALDFCRKAEENRSFVVIIWIDASSPISVKQSYRIAAKRLSKREQNDIDDQDVVLFVKDALRDKNDPWLLVFDNYDDPKAFQECGIRHYIPDGKHGHFLFTSRHADTARLGRTIEVSGMSEDESLRLILQREPSNDEETVTGHRIASLLGYLALALDQASAYIRTRCLDLKDFIPHYERRKDLILQEIPDEWEYRRYIQGEERETRLRVFTTWELSHQQISGNEHDKRCKDHLLTLAAYFDNKLISAIYFQALFNSERPKWMELYTSEGEWDDCKLRDTLAELQKLSLLKFSKQTVDDLSFSIHPVIRDWIKLRKHESERQHYSWELITALASFLEGVEIDQLSLEMKQETVSHVDACIRDEGEPISERVRAIAEKCPQATFLFAYLYRSEGQYDEAERVLEGILAGIEERLGIKHPDTLSIVQNLAIVYRRQGRYDEAENLYKRALAGIEERLGLKHPDTLKTIQNLAAVYRDQGRYDEAEIFYTRALAGKEEKLGPKHPDTLQTAQNLAVVYRDQGRYDEAEILHTRALAGREERLGPKHPDTLQTVQNLAVVYTDQGRYDEAEILYTRALAGREKRLGPKHPDTLRTVQNLAAVYRDQGRYDEAEILYTRALAGREEKLGPKHPDTLQTVQNLAVVYRGQGQYDKAEILHTRALAGREERLGLKHPSTLRTAQYLASFYTDQGRYDQAEELYKKFSIE